MVITDQDIDELARAEELNFCPTRKSILKSLNSIDVQACPGSGKTTMIAAKLMLLSRSWSEKHKGICVLSHTNVAKDEIIKKIDESTLPYAKQLLAYPHFIGTIQSFVNQFLALPLIRSENISISSVETDQSVKKFWWSLKPNIRSSLEKKNAPIEALKKYHYTFRNEKFQLTDYIPFGLNPTTKTVEELRGKREALCLDGFFSIPICMR